MHWQRADGPPRRRARPTMSPARRSHCRPPPPGRPAAARMLMRGWGCCGGGAPGAAEGTPRLALCSPAHLIFLKALLKSPHQKTQSPLPSPLQLSSDSPRVVHFHWDKRLTPCFHAPYPHSVAPTRICSLLAFNIQSWKTRGMDLPSHLHFHPHSPPPPSPWF